MIDISSLSSEALLLEPRNVYDSCIIGVTRKGSAIYDAEKVIEAGVAIFATYEESVEWHDFNTFDAYYGEMTPKFKFS